MVSAHVENIVFASKNQGEQQYERRSWRGKTTRNGMTSQEVSRRPGAPMELHTKESRISPSSKEVTFGSKTLERSFSKWDDIFVTSFTSWFSVFHVSLDPQRQTSWWLSEETKNEHEREMTGMKKRERTFRTEWETQLISFTLMTRVRPSRDSTTKTCC